MYEIEAVRITYLEGTKMLVLFSDNKTKEVDMAALFDEFPEYKALINRKLFLKGKLHSNYFLIWSNELEILADTLYRYGKDVENEDTSVIAMIGYKIKKARLEKDMSQVRLSKLTGIDQADISKIENGQANPSIMYLKKISNVLNKNLIVTLK